MRTRREQVQAHRFVTRRIISALLSGEPEAPDLPMRRLAMAVFGSVMVAAIVLAVVGVYGLLNPGGRRPAENTLLIERETGARYLYLQGKLHPVLNYTSARLILGQANPPVVPMSARSLLDIPRGRAVGIANAPDTLPGRSSLLGLPWSVCSAPRSATSVQIATHVFAGRIPPGGAGLDERGLLVSGGPAGLFLLWHDHRLLVRGNTTLTALEWAAVRPIAVGEAFLNAIPAGPDLVAATVPGSGSTASRQVDGKSAKIGQLFRGGAQHYVMLASGLSPIGEVMTRLLLAGGTPATDISTQEAGRALTEARLEPSGFPGAIPALRAGGAPAMACAAYRGPGERAQPQITVEAYAQIADGVTVDEAAPIAGGLGSDGVVTADRVTVPGGHAAVVSTLQESAAGAIFLVTDQGLKYPMPRDKSDQVLTSLGYGGVRPVPVPASILALVPTAPSLDPDAATRFAGAPAVSPVRPSS
ncbi:type VII secretion protein EccB [Rhizocola hellebori]|uniref:Type VII secretion protein EccB n=1 Tax=Rhizocola hellebori TaxID=1392758 RepID=A0A8J3QF29_9ACTN|nr:type VII secretion protein EccB [Rhizocola hellebori]GIH09705.1 type VII secretion protein EccB [Rhizocola hellebori]